MHLLMEQNRDIILELRGRRTAPGDGDTRRPGSNTSLARDHGQGPKDDTLSVLASQFWESRHGERVHILGSWEQRMEDMKKEMVTMRKALKGKAPATVDKMI